MTAQVTLNLSEKLYDQVKNLAKSYQRGLAETIVAHLEKTLSRTEIVQEADDLRTQHKALDNEKVAYMKLHAKLKSTHAGNYVAIYQGKLIDTDRELGAMVERVREQLPDQVVWMTQVKDEPIQTIVRRGNRLLRIMSLSLMAQHLW